MRSFLAFSRLIVFTVPIAPQTTIRMRMLTLKTVLAISARIMTTMPTRFLSTISPLIILKTTSTMTAATAACIPRIAKLTTALLRKAS